MGADATSITAEVGGLTLTRHPARSKRARPVTLGRQCIATGSLLEGGQAGVASVISIHCRDANGQRRTQGGDVVTVSLVPEGSAPIDAHITDNTDGTYTCTLLPQRASPHCTLTVMVNGTRIEGSPFKTQILPGGTDASCSEVYGRGLYDGMSGRRCEFTIATKDSYGNRCSMAGDKFAVSIHPVQSLVKELEPYMRKYEVATDVTDNEDGTHTVGYQVEYAGFYRIDVTRDCVPVSMSPYTATIFNTTISFPPMVLFMPLPATNDDALPTTPSHDCALVHDLLAMLQSQAQPGRKGVVSREYLHYYKLKQNKSITGNPLPVAGKITASGRLHTVGQVASATHMQWHTIRLRGPLPPVANRRSCIAVDQTLVALCSRDFDEHGAEISAGTHPDRFGPDGARVDGGEDHAPELSKINEVRSLDLSELTKPELGWQMLRTEGKPPNAVVGMATAVWDGRGAILCSGGKAANGKVTTDVFLLQLSASSAVWRTLTEWPGSIFSGEGFSARQHHSMTFLPPSSFWIFGGVDAEGELLNDLHYFDMTSEAWTKPATLGELPAPRTGHGACFVAERYLVVYGGTDAEGKVIETASVYDIIGATWHNVVGVAPRAGLRMASRGGVMYVLGGVGAAGKAVSQVPLGSEMFPFAQRACLDFLGNKEQVLSIKPSNSINSLRNCFTVEAVVKARSFPAYGPICCRTNNSMGVGFGLMGLEHPAFKGDAEEGARIHFFVGNWGTTGGGQEVNVPVETDTWYHVAGTYDGKELRIYLNGTLGGTFEHVVGEEESAEGFHSKGDLQVGGLPGKYAWDGFVDEVRLWDVARNADEVKLLMNDVSVGTTANLVGQWTFNEGAGEGVIDSSGNRNHGSYEKYAGGVELRRVQSRRGVLKPAVTASERMIDANFLKLAAWKKDFMQKNGRDVGKVDIICEPEMLLIARRLGEFDTYQ